MRSRQLFAFVILLGWCGVLAAQEQVILNDDFESGEQAFGANWTLWADSSWVSQPGRCGGGPVNCYGPDSAHLRIDYEHSHYYPAVGNTGVRHVIAQPDVDVTRCRSGVCDLTAQLMLLVHQQTPQSFDPRRC